MMNFLLFQVLVACTSLVADFDVGPNVNLAISPVLGAALIGGASSLISGLFGASSQRSANEQNAQIARENRDWQSDENVLNRQWSEKMWEKENLYNTPSAMRERLEEAGYNPNALFDASSSLRGGNVSSPSMVGSPNMPEMRPVNFGQGLEGLGNSVALGLQAKQVDAESSNQQAQATSSIIQALSQAYKELGKDGFFELSKRIAPYMQSINPDDSFWTKQIKSVMYNQDMDSLNKELQFELGKKYSAEQILTGIQEANYRISEIVGRLHTMNVQNEQLVKKTAAEIVRSYADAFRLRKEGEKFVADKQTVDALRSGLKRQYDAAASIAEDNARRSDYMLGGESSWLNWLNSREGRESYKESKRIPLERKADAVWTAVDRLFDDYIKVTGSPAGSSNEKTTTYYFTP